MASSSTHIYQQLPDTNQKSWELAAIQLTGMTSLPVLTASVLMIQQNNLINSILNLILGNIILWIIRFGIVLMSFKGRKSTLDVSRDYVGHFGSYFIAILLLVSSLVWFIAQTTLASNALASLFPYKGELGINRFIQISVLLGILSTVLCMEGIVAIRWVTTICLPILLLSFIGVIFASHELPSMKEVPSSITFMQLPLVLATSLGVTADIPTFFRHSSSLKAAINALTIIQLVSLAIGIGALFLGSVISPWLGINLGEGFASQSTLLKVSLITLIFVSAICSNITNVYSASVGWELIAPILAGRKEYLILGLGLTTIFILVSNIFSTHVLLETADTSLMNLCIVLITGFAIHLLTQATPKTFEKSTYFGAWALGTLVNFLQFSGVLFTHYSPAMVGVLTVLIFIISMFTAREIYRYARHKFF